MIRPSFIKEITEDNMTIKDWIIEILWYNNFSCFLRKIGRFILRLIRWIPVLYEQEEWDYEYIYDMLKLKMIELKENISKDTWHKERGVKRSLLQINVCLSRLDRFQNWDQYIKIPEVNWELEQGNRMYFLCSKEESEEYDEAILKGIEFEKKNYKKFWEDFIKWHNNWWT